MSTLKVLDGNRAVKYLKVNGTGTELDPFVPVQDVNLQDQTSPALFVKASKVTNTTTVSATAAADSYDIQVATTVGITAGDYLGVFNLAADRFYVGTIVSITSPGVNGILNMDMPLDFQFEVGDVVGTGITNMNVNGATTAQTFTVRGADPGIDVTVDVTRFIITCITDTAVDLNKFGDIAALTRGLFIRRVDGFTQNIVNWKSNAEMAGSMFDWSPYAATNPSQGVDGFVARLTLAGANKLGVAIRLEPGDTLEFVVQDDLTGITSFEVMVEGHVVV